MKKRITGIITALAVSMSLSVFVNADNSGIYNNPETARSLKNYLLSDSAAGVDVNHDGTVNILDLIDYKAAALDIDMPEGAFKLSSIPKYSGTPYAVVNDNVPFFRYKGYTECFEYYTELDALGRCGTTIALVGKETMPTEPRGEIGMVKPTGWHTYKYDCIPDIYLYNRCHLIGFQLSGENANVKNLITGTRYMNVTGMEPFESKIAGFIKSSGKHVIYRVTPIFEGNNLVAHGVLMEAYSLEDQGKGLSLNVFCYNVLPGIEIDYATGESKYVGGEDILIPPVTTTAPPVTEAPVTQPVIVTTKAPDVTDSSNPAARDYVLNMNTKKFHYPTCGSVNQMSQKNRKDVHLTRDEIVSQGYSPCGNCKP